VISAIPFYASAGTDALLGTAIDTFDSYTTGSVASTVLTGGSGWADTGFTSATSNLAAQVYTQYVGTTNSPDETFEQYATGTVDSGTTISLGTFWTGNAFVTSFAANPVPQVYIELAGTGVGSPYETWEQYGTTSGTLVDYIYGSYWGAAGTIYTGSFSRLVVSTSNPLALSGTQALAGTGSGSPYDTFEFYGTGTVVSGVTLAGGSFWGGIGLIY
jgi:hypothetical protein